MRRNEDYRKQRALDAHVKGEDCHLAKLTRTQVEEIKSMLRQKVLMKNWIAKEEGEGRDPTFQKEHLKSFTHKAIADKFGVSDKNISSIHHERSWKHVI